MFTLFKYNIPFIFILLTINGTSQISKYSNEFLAIGVGARQLGMGNAVVSSVDDVTSGYWNPAGLQSLKTRIQIGLMHSEYFAGIAKYDYGAMAIRLDSQSVAAISLIRFGVDNIPNTTQLIDVNGNVDYDKISKFNATDFAAILSYSKKLNKLKNLEIGANAKIIRRKIGDFANAWGFGLDIGLNCPLKNNWKFSIVGKDITGTFNAWSYNLDNGMKSVFEATRNDIPQNGLEITVPRLITGISKKIGFLKNKFHLLSELDINITFDGKRNVLIKNNLFSIDPQLGIELDYINLIFFRFGLNNYQTYINKYNNSNTTIQPNIGVGLCYKAIALDYALSNIGNSSIAPYSHILSLKLNLNNKKVKI